MSGSQCIQIDHSRSIIICRGMYVFVAIWFGGVKMIKQIEAGVNRQIGMNKIFHIPEESRAA